MRLACWRARPTLANFGGIDEDFRTQSALDGEVQCGEERESHSTAAHFSEYAGPLCRSVTKRRSNCVFPFVQPFSFLMKASTKGKGETKEVRFDPIFFAASVPARKPTAKDLKDVEEHENDPVEPKDHDTMDDTVE